MPSIQVTSSHSTSGTLYSQRLLRVISFSFNNSAVPSTGGNLSLRHRVSKDANHFHPPPGKTIKADMFQHMPHPDKSDSIFWPEDMVPHFPANVNSFFFLLSLLCLVVLALKDSTQKLTIPPVAADAHTDTVCGKNFSHLTFHPLHSSNYFA